MRKSLSVFLIYVFLMLADGGLTLYNTPDLSLEGNPLVTVFHLGWKALITVNLIFFVIVFLACRYTFDTYETVKTDVPNLKSYISQLFYNRPDKFIWTLYKIPKNWKPFWAWLGYVSVYSMCSGAVVRILEWLAVSLGLDTSGYDRLRGNVFFGRFDIAVGLILCIPLSIRWFRREYQKSCTFAAAGASMESLCDD